MAQAPVGNGTTEDHASARAIALEAAATLLEVRRQVGFADSAALRAAGDARSQERIAKLLAESHPGDAVLSEESDDDAIRLESSRVWVIDPLDGTREFGEEGRDDFAVHVALVVDHHPVVGAVALPGRGVCFGTDDPPAVPTVGERVLRVAASRSRPPDLVGDLCSRLGAQVVPMGSAGVKVMAVVTGEVDMYVHGGGQYEWDSAAPVAVALAAGLHASRLDGTALAYNQPDPWMPDLLVCRQELAGPVLEAVASL